MANEQQFSDELLDKLIAGARSIVALSEDHPALGLADSVLEMAHHLSKGGQIPTMWQTYKPTCNMHVEIRGGPKDGQKYICRKDADHPGDC